MGTSFETIRKIFDVIIQSTNNCEKYTYIVIAVLNLCSIKESYKRQLCRFFKQASSFVDVLRQGSSWNWSGSLIYPHTGPREIENINNINAPIIGMGGGGETFKIKNEKLSALIEQLINICNRPITTRPKSYIGNCSGFGIDILLVSHNKLDGSDGIIASLPLSLRSSRLIKSSQPGNFLRNKKYVHELILYILNQLTIGTYNRNPLLSTHIDCTVNEEPDNIDMIINKFLIDRGPTITREINARSGSRNKWEMDISKGGKKTRRKKQRKTRKKGQKRRKTRRKPKRKHRRKPKRKHH